jgi:hypothetical protein
VIAVTAVPPAASKVIVYELIFHCAVDVPPPTGIVAGIAGLHPANVYPVLLGAVGVAIDEV